MGLIFPELLWALWSDGELRQMLREFSDKIDGIQSDEEAHTKLSRSAPDATWDRLGPKPVPSPPMEERAVSCDDTIEQDFGMRDQNICLVPKQVHQLFWNWNSVYMSRCDHCESTFLSYPLPNICPSCARHFTGKVSVLKEDTSVRIATPNAESYFC